MSRWERTHGGLRRAALELFAELGYERATTAQIAHRAGVSEMTLFRHFPTKESLVLSDPFDPLMAEQVRTRPAGEEAMRALAGGIREAWTRVDRDSVQGLRDLLILIVATPALDGAIERSSGATTAALAQALAERGVPETQARVAAAAVIAGLSVALTDWARAQDRPLADAIGSALSVLGDD